MKTPAIFVAVAAAHLVAVGSLLLIQGCGTTRPSPTPSPAVEAPMPPPVVPEPRVAVPAVPPVPARSWPDETTTYIVKSGDTLSGIAARFGLKTAELAALNGITNPNMIRVGAKLVLPKKVDVAAPPAAPAPVPAARAGTGTEYVVQAGDTLSGLAVKFRVTVAAIRSANGLKSDVIRVGQKLVIPATVAVDRPERGDPPVPHIAEPGPKPVEPAKPERVETAGEPEAASPAAADAVSVEEHVVEEGEDLYSVGMMWGVSADRIKAFNNLAGTELKPGQRLKIPLTDH